MACEDSVGLGDRFSIGLTMDCYADHYAMPH